MRIQAAGRTDVGREREQNEDLFVVAPDIGLYGVCDGMGGHAAGETAAAVALEAATRVVRHRPWIAERVRSGAAEVDALMALLERSIRVANTDVFSLARENPAYSGMGCTITLLLAAGDHAALASVGDSRFYLLRHGHVQQLTLDHTIGQEALSSGFLKAEDMAGFRYARLLSRAVGTKEAVRADVFPLDLTKGDRFVACTDGLSDYIASEDWLGEQIATGRADEIAERLVSFANESGGSDNITVVVGIVEA